MVCGKDEVSDRKSENEDIVAPQGNQNTLSYVHKKKPTFLEWLTFSAVGAATIAAICSAISAHNAVTISREQQKNTLEQQQRAIERISFYFHVTNEEKWTIKILQTAGVPSNLDTIHVEPTFKDQSGEPYRGVGTNKTVSPLGDRDGYPTYLVKNVRQDICRVQKDVPNCEKHTISSLLITYYVENQERTERLN